MEARLIRWYERNPRRYLGFMLGLIGTWLVVPVTTSVLLAARFMSLSVAEFLIAEGAVMASIVVVFAWCAYAAGDELRAMVRAPSLSAASDALGAETFAAAIAYPAAVALGGLWRAVLLTGPTAVIAVVGQSEDGTLLDVFQVAIGTLFTILYVIAVVYLCCELGVRPVRLAMGRHDAGGTVAIRFGSVLMWCLPILLLASAAITGAMVADPDSSDGLLRAYAFSIAGTAMLLLVALVPLTLTILGPIRKLTAGTRAVAAGDLDTQVPVTSSDEFGELTSSFNVMTARLSEHAREMMESRARIVVAADDARRRVERDLHDGAQQHLVLLRMKLGMADRAFDTDPAKANELLKDARTELDVALEELRNLAHGIYPALLENDGLPAALSEAGQRATIATEVNTDGAGRYPPEIEAAVYFCCLEALQNASKHAGESARATVSLAQQNGMLEFAVSDDGHGYDTEAVGASAGLQNMADRIGALGGSLDIRSAPGSGTTVAGSVPAKTVV